MLVVCVCVATVVCTFVYATLENEYATIRFKSIRKWKSISVQSTFVHFFDSLSRLFPITYLRVFFIFHVSAVLLVYFSENINELAAIHWKSFSRQQYFDSNGLFISTVFSIPILLNCMLMIVSRLLIRIHTCH